MSNERVAMSVPNVAYKKKQRYQNIDHSNERKKTDVLHAVANNDLYAHTSIVSYDASFSEPSIRTAHSKDVKRCVALTM
jgi:hypothetical protein